ncbi:motile sperm domain-containing 2 [Brachionus plicatilis]|uniref:Motile sperm domain-containing 2 n=1 Tax=Brachionus plicatilis TaxID=10195 RepID=A0A3M7SJU4_BRAPC|nr:motile sperm domain-containing 2 [Brachionus plicatilis]
MEIKNPHASEELLLKIQGNFLEKYESKINSEAYHPKDVERIRQNTKWLLAFYKHAFANPDRAVDLIDEVLTWRKEFGANDFLTPGKLPFSESILEIGALFKRNKDKNGLTILNFRTKTHRKGGYPHEELCKFVAYFFEKEYKFSLDEPIVLLFDMTDSGLSNTDLDFAKFLISCLKTYYPGLIHYLIVFNMPFILNAVWKIIKALLPAKAVELVQFTDKQSIKKFIDDDNLFTHMGGKDAYVYSSKDIDY